MWVARDKGCGLTLFDFKPIREDDMWCQSDDLLCSTMDLDSRMFSEVKWEDEPLEVEILPKGHFDAIYQDLQLAENLLRS